MVIASSGLAIAFLIASVLRDGRKALLIVASVGFSLLDTYELYMWRVWERTVHAPIRLDMLLLSSRSPLHSL